MKYLLITFLAIVLAGASVEDAQKANEAYENGNYEEAISLYKKAIDADPENAKLYYNLASAQTRAGKNEEAIRTFTEFKTMVKNPQDRAKADYNLGNVFANIKKWDKAVDYYKKSLRYISDDADAKHNFELAKQKEKQQKKKQNKDNQKQKKNQDKQQKKDQNQQQKNQQQKNNKQNQQNQQNQQNKQDNKQENQQNKQQQQAKMSKAQAEKILKALEQKEKDLLKQFKKPKTESRKNNNGKDW